MRRITHICFEQAFNKIWILRGPKNVRGYRFTLKRQERLERDAKAAGWGREMDFMCRVYLTHPMQGGAW